MLYSALTSVFKDFIRITRPQMYKKVALSTTKKIIGFMHYHMIYPTCVCAVNSIILSQCQYIWTRTRVGSAAEVTYSKLQFLCTSAETSTNTELQRLEVVPPTIDEIIGYAGVDVIDDQLRKKVQVLLLEIESFRIDGQKVPSAIKLKHWKEILLLDSRSKRRRYYEFLFKTEMKKLAQMKKKKERQGQRAVRATEKETGHIQYGLGKNTIFLKIYETSVDKIHNQKLYRAMRFGQPLVFDCGHEHKMTRREVKYTARQICNLFAYNRQHVDPLDLHLCNYDPHGLLAHHLSEHIPSLDYPEFPLNTQSVSYLDIFPKDKLVYLTPHCQQEMTAYDHDAVYIVGAIVDLEDTQPYTLAKAKEDNIRMAKLPLDRYLNWGSGSKKSLSLVAMLEILVDLQHSGDWQKALNHIPHRKLKCGDEDEEEVQRTLVKLRKTRPYSWTDQRPDDPFSSGYQQRARRTRWQHVAESLRDLKR